MKYLYLYKDGESRQVSAKTRSWEKAEERAQEIRDSWNPVRQLEGKLDPDVISATNCVRQPFSRSEVGLYKAVVLANRLNLFWGLDWQGIPERLDTNRRLDWVDIVIGCVDTRVARAAIAKCAEDWSEVDYWLDLGNNADSGQFVLGEPLNRRNRRHRLRLRTVPELFPEVIQGELDGDGLPSCSAAEALDRQEPFVNLTLANHALALLARLFRYGTISYHGGFISLSLLSKVQALRADPKYWLRLRRKATGRKTQPSCRRGQNWPEGIRADYSQVETVLGVLS